VAYITLLPSV